MSTLEQASPALAPPRDDHSRLRRELDRFDTVFFLISAMVVVDTIGAIAIGGAQAFTWLVVLLRRVLRAVGAGQRRARRGDPGGGRRVRLGADGLRAVRRRADVAALLGGHADVAGRLGHRRRHRGRASASSATSARPARYAFGAAFIGAATVGAVIPLRYGKWVPTSGAIGQIVLLAFFTATRGRVRRRARRPRPRRSPDMAPTFAVFIAVVPVLLYSFVGIELPSAAAEEMVDPRRDIPVGHRAGRRLPGGDVRGPDPRRPRRAAGRQISSLHGLIDAMQTVFTVYGGSGGRRRSAGSERRAVRLGAAGERLGVDHRRRPGAGRGVPRRRGAAPCSGASRPAACR